MKSNNKLHVAIIMDGNGRWAKSKGQKRTYGHKKGAETVRKITEYCSENSNISELTLYAFSTENWKRPKIEIEFLMQLLANYLDKELDNYQKNNIKFNSIGDISHFSKKLQSSIFNLEESTKNNTDLIHNLALNYGSQDEITRAVNKTLAQKRDSHILITKEEIEHNLDTQTDVDILIRTGGDKRISNFMLWQSAYAELFFCDVLWPDFDINKLEKIIAEFNLRERRFGGLNETDK
jgi:undecaprenyl diphosphate synthase